MLRFIFIYGTHLEAVSNFHFTNFCAFPTYPFVISNGACSGINFNQKGVGNPILFAITASMCMSHQASHDGNLQGSHLGKSDDYVPLFVICMEPPNIIKS